MQAANTEFMIAAAQKHPSDPIAAAVLEAADDAVYRALRQKLEATKGLRLQITPSPGKSGRFVARISREIPVEGQSQPELEIIAQANAGSEKEALLHACLGYLREKTRGTK